MSSEELIDLQNRDMTIDEFCNRFCRGLFDLKPNPKMAEQQRNLIISKIKHPSKFIKSEFEKTLDRCLNDVYDLELKNIDLGSRGEKTIFDLEKEKCTKLTPEDIEEFKKHKKIDNDLLKLLQSDEIIFNNELIVPLTPSIPPIPEFPVLKK